MDTKETKQKPPMRTWTVSVTFQFLPKETGSLEVWARTKRDAIKYARREMWNRGYDRFSGRMILKVIE